KYKLNRPKNLGYSLTEKEEKESLSNKENADKEKEKYGDESQNVQTCARLPSPVLVSTDLCICTGSADFYRTAVKIEPIRAEPSRRGMIRVGGGEKIGNSFYNPHYCASGYEEMAGMCRSMSGIINVKIDNLRPSENNAFAFSLDYDASTTTPMSMTGETAK
ncbi:hypothetical protein RRG08_001122, partial [Elysia crispata]